MTSPNTSGATNDIRDGACRAFSISAADVPLEGEDHPTHGDVTWHTLMSSDRTPSSGLVLGIAQLRPGGWLGLHRHAPAEFYLGLSGEGTATIDGVAHRVAAGIAVFIPGNAEHSITAGSQGLSFAYGFAQNSFADIEYRFTADDPAPQAGSEGDGRT